MGHYCYICPKGFLRPTITTWHSWLTLFISYSCRFELTAAALKKLAESFNSYKSQVNLTGLIELCEREGKTVIYEREEYLLHQGEIEKHISLVKSGYCRYACLKSDGGEAVVGLAMAGEFVTDFNNGVRRIPALASQVASVRTEVLQLPFEYALERLCQSEPNFLYTASDALFRMCYTRLLELYVLSPTERYRKFAESYPDIVSRIKVKELASYLQISHQHLLRIKKSQEEREKNS